MSESKKDTFTLNEIELVYRPLKELSQRPVVCQPYEAHELFRENWNSMKIGIVEEFKIMLLNNAMIPLGISNISTGGINSTIADPKVIFGIGLKAGATGIILAHNHPSGILTPSKQDIQLQKDLEKMGKLLGIKIIDHIILSGIDNTFRSLNDPVPF